MQTCSHDARKPGDRPDNNAAMNCGGRVMTIDLLLRAITRPNCSAGAGDVSVCPSFTNDLNPNPGQSQIFCQITRAYDVRALSGAGSLSAQPSDETITVTASRLPMDSLRSGSQITIITKADIDLQNPASLPDLLRGQPGLSISQQSGTGGLTQVRMRGREANHVLVLD